MRHIFRDSISPTRGLVWSFGAAGREKPADKLIPSTLRLLHKPLLFFMSGALWILNLKRDDYCSCECRGNMLGTWRSCRH